MKILYEELVEEYERECVELLTKFTGSVVIEVSELDELQNLEELFSPLLECFEKNSVNKIQQQDIIQEIINRINENRV